MKRATDPIKIDRERFPVDDWRLVERGRHDDNGLAGTLFAIGNGYLGLRADWAPDPQSAGTYVNGFHETFPIVHPEKAHALAETGQSILNAPDAKSMELAVDGEVLSIADGAEITDFQREIDFRTGVLTSRFTWHPRRGGRVAVVSERLVSLTRRHLAVLRLSVTVSDATAPVTLRSLLVNRQDIGVPATGSTRDDPRRGRTFDNRVLEPALQSHDGADASGGLVTLAFRCMASGMRIAVSARHTIDSSARPTLDTDLSPDTATTTVAVAPGDRETVVFTKYVAYHAAGQIDDETERADVDELARRSRETLDGAVPVGWDALAGEQAAWLAWFWSRTDIAVEGDADAQQAIRWNLFQMAQASANVGERGIAAKAVTAGGYDGHYFWDTEVYVIPMLAYNNPDAARDLLRFRHRTLPRARQRAAQMSQRGALFPWRTLNGEEASAYYPAGTAQYHIDADVAYALDRYVNATGDIEFLRHEGAEMLVEIARFFADVGFYDAGESPQFHIHGVTGPDEYTAVVDDNVYTNVMARFALRFAANTVNMLGSHHPDDLRRLVDTTDLHDDEVDAWTQAADAMCVLYDPERGINPQDQSFLRHEPWDWEGVPADKYPLLLNFHPLVIYRHQVLKQADVVLANFLRGEDFAADVQRRNFDYYDAITTGDSSLSACVQGIMASEVGHAELARQYFDESLYLDIADTHGNTVDGTHIANVGGVWAGLVHGFAGVRDTGTHVRVAPRLPDGWRSMRFKLHRRGSDIAIALDRDGATITVESGGPVPIMANGTVTNLAAGQSRRVETVRSNDKE